MEQFASDYVAGAVADPKSTFAMLTPDYQRASGGLGQYQKFWSRWSSATVSRVSADPAAGTVSYHVVYVPENPKDTGFADNVTLQLEQDGDSFLIAGAS